jgi:hypothetical protein
LTKDEETVNRIDNGNAQPREARGCDGGPHMATIIQRSACQLLA